MTILAILYIAAGMIGVAEVLLAPRGYQIEGRGFFYGEPE